MDKATVQDVEVKGKRVLVRVDFNVTLDESNPKKIPDDFRIQAALPTIRYLIQQGAKAILCSHLDRPEGHVVDKWKMTVVGKRLSELLERQVPVMPDCIGPDVDEAVAQLEDGDVLLLENLRFHAGEESNDPDFARLLAKLGDLYVNDAFATAHRLHASVVTVPKLMSHAVAGLLMVKEIEALTPLVTAVSHPYGAIFGGAKISDKIGIIRHFLRRADVLVVGGAMANTFLRASGKYVGSSKVEDAWVEAASQILKEVKRRGSCFLLPTDVVVAKQFEPDAEHRIVGIDEVPDGWCVLDVGPRTIEHFARELGRCKTIVWNGPLGKFEWEKFAQGSRQMAEALGKIPAYRVAGGGDTSALHHLSDIVMFCDYISTGGGSFLQFLEGRELPGIAVLDDE